MAIDKASKNIFKILYFNILVFISIFSSFGSLFLAYDFFTRKPTKIDDVNISDFKTLKEVLSDGKLNIDFSVSYTPDFAINFLNLKSNLYPINGISNILTYLCNEQDYLSNYVSDRHGFNNPDNVFKKGKIDIALIGDSYIHGACTNKNTIRNVLDDLSQNKLSIASFAQGGTGPLLQLAYLKEYAQFYKPKKIYWFWVGNDLRNIQDELQSPVRNYMQDEYTQNLIVPENKFIVDNHVKDYFELLKNKLEGHPGEEYNLSFYRFRRKLKQLFPKTYSSLLSIFYKFFNYRLISNNNLSLNRITVLTRKLPKNEFKLMELAAKDIMKEVGKLAKDLESELTIIYIGFGGFSSNPFIDKKRFSSSNSDQKKLLKEISIENGFEFYDLDAAIDKEFLPSDHISGHFSDKGYIKVGSIIYNDLINKE